MAITLRYFTEFVNLSCRKRSVAEFMQESIAFLVRVQCRRKESSRSLSHLLMSFLYIAVSSYEILSVNFVKNLCISFLKPLCFAYVLSDTEILISQTAERRSIKCTSQGCSQCELVKMTRHFDSPPLNFTSGLNVRELAPMFNAIHLRRTVVSKRNSISEI